MNKGFISWIVIAVVALALAYYFFDWSIFTAIESDKGQATITYIKNIFVSIWNFLVSVFNSIF